MQIPLFKPVVSEKAIKSVGSSVHYRRNDICPMYEKQELPNMEQFWKSVISLPMHITLTDEQVDYITDIIRGGR